MKCIIIDLGLMPYGECLALQEKIVELKQKEILAEDVFLVVEHPPVLTFGVNTNENELRISRGELKQMGIEIFEIKRGGNVTYHGPGQIVGYPIMKMTLSDSMNFPAKLEELMLKTGRKYCEKLYVRTDAKPENKKRYVGVWHEDAGVVCKIGSVGVQFKQYGGELFSMHGFALNVCTRNLEHFDLIDPCGLKDVKVSSLQKICGFEINVDKFKEELIKEFCGMFKFEMKKINKTELINLLHTFSQQNHPTAHS